MKNDEMNYWYNQWEKQQNSLIEMREERFNVMLKLIEIQGKTNPNALDLGCGPGSFSKRFLNKFPRGYVTAIDYDPVTLEIFKNTVDNDNITILNRDLRNSEWHAGIKEANYDVIFTTTALHWLPENCLASVYQKSYRLLHDNGVLMNGDHFGSSDTDLKITGLYNKIKEDEHTANIKNSAMNWDEWWDNLRKTGMMDELFKERGKRFNSGNHDQHVSLEKHITFLKDSGFQIIDIPWKYLDNMIIMALK